MKGNDWIILGALGVLLYLGYARGGGQNGGAGDAFTPGNWQRDKGDLTTYLASPGPEVFTGWSVAEQQNFLDVTGRTYQDAPPGWSNLDWEDFLKGV